MFYLGKKIIQYLCKEEVIYALYRYFEQLIKVYIHWNDHLPPHFYALYGGSEVLVSIEELEVIEGSMPSKQLKMLIGWASFHQEELRENWELAKQKQELFAIEPLK